MSRQQQILMSVSPGSSKGLATSQVLPRADGSKGSGAPLITFFLFLSRVHLDPVAEMENLVPLEILAPLALQVPLVPLALVQE